MPEIYEMFINMSELLRLLPKSDNDVYEQIKQYEAQLEHEMAQNRVRLFGPYGYVSEFERI